MTKDQLHTAFKIELDKSGNMGYPAFLPEEIDYWLDKALYQVISNKFTGNNTLKQPFEKSVKRISDLKGLIYTAILPGVKEDNINKIVFTNAFDGKLFYVQAVLSVDDKIITNVDLVEHANAKQFLQTYDNTPWIETPVAVIENKNLTVYVDPISMIGEKYKIELTYVMKPITFSDVSANEQYQYLGDNVLQEIVSRATALALENIESPRVQTKTQLNQIDE